MSDNEMLYCLIAFILGWLASRMMGNGFSVGATYSVGGKPPCIEYETHKTRTEIPHNKLCTQIGSWAGSPTITNDNKVDTCKKYYQGGGLGGSNNICQANPDPLKAECTWGSRCKRTLSQWWDS
mgnify:CR=1 FL=1